MSKLQTKSKRGGRRPGAGRKADSHSIRGSLKQATDGRERGENWTHSFTKWEIERDSYISNHAHRLIIFLSLIEDGSGRPNHPVLSRHAAYQIAHLDKSIQPKILLMTHANKLQRLYEMHGDSPHDVTQFWARVCGYLLEHEQVPEELKP